MKQLLLSGNSGEATLVDEADYEKASRYKWYLLKTPWANYAAGKIDNKTVYLHRFVTNPSKNKQVDHINGNGLDNRQSNLRICSSAQNSRNTKPRKNSSGYKGVTRFVDTKTGILYWWVRVNKRTNGSNNVIYQKLHKDLKEAAKDYNRMAIATYGQYARLNEVS